MHFAQPSFGHTPHITCLESETSSPELEGERLPEGEEHKGSVAQVLSFVDGFRQFCAGKPGSRSPEIYESTFSIRVTAEEFSRLTSELNISLENDERSGSLTYLTSRVE